MITLPITVFGFGDLYREVFNAIATVTGSDSYHALLKLGMVVGVIWAAIHYSMTRSFKSMGQFFLSYFVVTVFLLAPNATVFITDEINESQFYNVDHVPYGLAVMASFSSRFGAALTQLMEEVFSTPDDVSYSHTGMVMASRMMENTSQFVLTDPSFNQSLASFMHECVFYDLLLHRYSYEELLNTNDLWSFLKQHASKARAFELTSPSGQSQIETCAEGVPTLSTTFQTVLESAASFYGGRLYPESLNAKETLLSHLQNAWSQLGNTSVDGMSLLTQSFMVNSFNQAILSQGLSVDSPASVQAYTLAKSEEQIRLSSTTSGQLASYWLPLINALLKIVLYALFVLMVPFIFTPLGLSLLQKYVATLVWLELWAPVYAVVNLAMTFYAGHHTLPLVKDVGGLTLANQAAITRVNADIVDLAGWLSVLVPFLAGGVLFGFYQAFHSVSHYMGGILQSQGTAGAHEGVGGNLSLGNFQYSNQSMFNDSGFHLNLAAQSQAGSLTTQLPGGSQLSLMADGSHVLNNQPALSNLGTNVQLANTLRESYQHQADASYSSGLNEVNAYSQSLSEAARHITDASQQVGHGFSVSEGSGENTSFDTQASLQHIHSLTDSFAHNHHLSYNEAASVLTQAYGSVSGQAGLGASLGVGPSANVNLGAGTSHQASNTDNVAEDSVYQEAKQYVQTSGYQENMNHAVQAFQNHQVQGVGDVNERFVSQIGQSLDQSEGHRTEAMANFQKADSYRQMASLAEENSVNINANASQAYYEWLEKQPNPDGTGPMGARGVEAMMTHHPEAAESAAKAFSATDRAEVAHGWAHELSDSPASVSATYQGERTHVKGDEAVLDANRQEQKETLADMQKTKEDIQDVRDETGALVKKTMDRDAQTMNQRKDQTEKSSEALEKTIQAKHESRSSVFKTFVTGVPKDKSNPTE